MPITDGRFAPEAADPEPTHWESWINQLVPLPGAPQSVFRGSRQFHPILSEPKPRRPIEVVGCRPRVGAALLSLPTIPFCIFSCHALSSAVGRSVPGGEPCLRLSVTDPALVICV
jgi:hypothetical protein